MPLVRQKLRNPALRFRSGNLGLVIGDLEFRIRFRSGNLEFSYGLGIWGLSLGFVLYFDFDFIFKVWIFMKISMSLSIMTY